MLWFLSVLVAAIARTGEFALFKSALRKIDPLILATAATLFTVIIYSPIFALSYIQNPVISESDIVLFVIPLSGLVNSLGLVVVLKAFKTGDFSVAVPLRDLVPIFSFFWAVLILGETVTLSIVAATLLVVIGAILLHIKNRRIDIRSRSSLYAIIAALLASFSIITDKVINTHIEPIKAALIVYGMMFVFLISFTVISGKFPDFKTTVLRKWRSVVPIPLFAIVGTLGVYTALSLANVTLVSPLIRIEVLFSVLAGGYFFKEKNMLFRLLGALFIFAGIFLIIS